VDVLECTGLRHSVHPQLSPKNCSPSTPSTLNVACLFHGDRFHEWRDRRDPAVGFRVPRLRPTRCNRRLQPTSAKRTTCEPPTFRCSSRRSGQLDEPQCRISTSDRGIRVGTRSPLREGDGWAAERQPALPSQRLESWTITSPFPIAAPRADRRTPRRLQITLQKIRTGIRCCQTRCHPKREQDAVPSSARATRAALSHPNPPNAHQR
jgi:hypothetical protein